MNNKGFTLIEILVVIALISSLGVIVTINISSMLNSEDNDKCSNFVKEVEEAACVYTGINKDICKNGCNITLGDLISDGFIGTDINACTNEEIDKSEEVKVTISSDGEKKCNYVRGEENEG